MANSVFYQGKEFVDSEVKLYSVKTSGSIPVARLNVESPYYLKSVINGINTKDDVSKFKDVYNLSGSDLQYFSSIINVNGIKFALCYARSYSLNFWCLANYKDITLVEQTV